MLKRPTHYRCEEKNLAPATLPSFFGAGAGHRDEVGQFTTVMAGGQDYTLFALSRDEPTEPQADGNPILVSRQTSCFGGKRIVLARSEVLCARKRPGNGSSSLCAWQRQIRHEASKAP